MSFLSMSPRFSSVTFYGDDTNPLVPAVLHVPGPRRAELARLRVTGPAVYLAFYDDERAYVGVSSRYSARAGESPHLDAYGVVQHLFVITEAEDRWSLGDAQAAERIIWETLNEVAGFATIGLIPRGAPLAERYGKVRAFCGRALQIVASTGHVLTTIPERALLAGATGNGDILGDDFVGFHDGTLYAFTGKEIEAQAVETDEGEWVLLRGSQIWSTPVPSAGQLVRVRLESLLYAGCLRPRESDPRLLVTRRDLSFSTASGAALFVAGSKGFGPAAWKRLCAVRNGMPGPLPRQP